MSSGESLSDNAQKQLGEIDHFRFRGLHPDVRLGTASDRYAGWVGQIYSSDRYAGRVAHRTNRVGGKNFKEEVLPVESVEEYFDHFPVLELDFTFYRLLLEADGKASQNYHVLRTYAKYLKNGDRVLIKVPQAVFAKRIRKSGRFVENEEYLDPDIFARRFYEPALALLDPWLEGFIFEQEYQRKQEQPSLQNFSRELDRFFGSIPADGRYHVELRTERFLAPAVFEVFERHGLGQVFSHWTWLPTLSRQFSLCGGRFTNALGAGVVRLMTPRGMRYEDAYAKAHPFDRLVEGMLSPNMVEHTVELMEEAALQDIRLDVIVNNRAGGNAPLVARRIAARFLDKTGSE